MKAAYVPGTLPCVWHACLCNLLDPLWNKYCEINIFILKVKKTEPQKGHISCPRSHSHLSPQHGSWLPPEQMTQEKTRAAMHFFKSSFWSQHCHFCSILLVTQSYQCLSVGGVNRRDDCQKPSWKLTTTGVSQPLNQGRVRSTASNDCQTTDHLWGKNACIGVWVLPFLPLFWFLALLCFSQIEQFI